MNLLICSLPIYSAPTNLPPIVPVTRQSCLPIPVARCVLFPDNFIPNTAQNCNACSHVVPGLCVKSNPIDESCPFIVPSPEINPLNHPASYDLSVFHTLKYFFTLCPILSLSDLYHLTLLSFSALPNQ